MVALLIQQCPREYVMIDPATEHFVTRFRDAGVCGAACDEWQVRDLERELQVQFPPAYRAFLLLCGNGWEPLEGSHYAVEDDLPGLQRAGQRIAEHEKASLPQDAFVFLVHQGFACQFFITQGDEDPVVFECVKGMGPITQVAPHFSDWILKELSRSAKLWERHSEGN